MISWQRKKEELEAKEKSIEDETEINFEELAQVKGELIRLNTSLEEAQKKLDEVQVTVTICPRSSNCGQEFRHTRSRKLNSPSWHIWKTA